MTEQTSYHCRKCELVGPNRDAHVFDWLHMEAYQDGKNDLFRVEPDCTCSACMYFKQYETLQGFHGRKGII